MGLETSYLVASGWNRRLATRRLQERALELADRSGDPLARAIALGGRSLGLYLEGRWRESLEANIPIDEIDKREAVGVWWERATGALYTILACFRTGDLEAVRWLERRWLTDARDRGDLYVASSVASCASARLRLMDDRVGDWRAARQALDRLWPRLRASLLLYFVDIRSFPRRWPAHPVEQSSSQRCPPRLTGSRSGTHSRAARSLCLRAVVARALSGTPVALVDFVVNAQRGLEMTLIQQKHTIASELFGGPPPHPPDARSLEHATALDSIVDEVARESAALLGLLRKLVAGVGDQLCAPADDPSAEGTPRRFGPYRVEAFVRSGGMGEIHRAVDERLRRTVALKVLPRHRSDDAHGRRRLLDEARLLSAVRHPNVCTLHDVGHSDGVDFLVMEYLDGSTLQEWLAQGPLTTIQALAIARQVANALEAVHRAGIVHGDLKPANIMLNGRREDPAPEVKLLDFGLARSIAEAARVGEEPTDCTTLTDPSLVQGTWPYLAPEQFGQGEVDSRTDVWALGVVLYEMVCGRRPFAQPTPAALAAAILRLRPTPPSKVSAECGRELSALIERCLDKMKSKRWSSCADLARRLDDLALSSTGRRPIPGRRFGHRAAAAASMVAVLMLRPLPSAAEGPRATEAGAESARVATAAASTQLDRARMEEILLRGRVGKLRPLSVGVSRSAKAPLSWQGTTHDVHVQTIDTYINIGSRYANQSDCYRYNVAAYRLDQMLGLGMVPVSVERSVAGRQAAVTWWIDDVEMMEIDRRKLGRKPVDARGWNRQMHRAAVFQELIANSDPNQTNQLITKDWKIWLVDFTRAFRVQRKLMRPQSLKRLDPELRAALERLERASLRAEMRGLLDKAQVAGILKRRDLILAHFASAAPSAAGSQREQGQV